MVRDSLEKLNEKLLKWLYFGMFGKSLREKGLFFFSTYLCFPIVKFIFVEEVVSIVKSAFALQVRRPKFLEFSTLLCSFDYKNLPMLFSYSL